MRIAAMALLIAAFSRPFFTSIPSRPRRRVSGAREVVILLDRSASMGYGDHWTRAQDEAQQGGATASAATTSATLVLFGTRRRRSRARHGRREPGWTRPLATPRCRSDATRYAPALRLAQSLLAARPLPRKEAFLISDFQKIGLGAAGGDPAARGRGAHADLRGRAWKPRVIACRPCKFQRDVVLRRGARDDHGRRDEPQHRSR